MKIEILGAGCKKCDLLYDNTLKALDLAGLREEAHVEKVKDIDQILKMGVYTTPALVVDGDVLSTGRVLSPEQILDKLRPKGP
ncbi:MAG: thioredoxin family protein [Deltaproteobacteria bacterium]|nr:thioredoxin family protein [Deltaproteobacteria bacterium]